VELAARRNVAGLAASELPGGFDQAAWTEALGEYFSTHDAIGTGPDARSAKWFEVAELDGHWRVRQVFDDPEGWHDTAIVAEIDLASSDDAGEPAWRTLEITRD
jgi:hypothetical protein